jgi:hypothetical protein
MSNDGAVDCWKKPLPSFEIDDAVEGLIKAGLLRKGF